MRTTKRTVWLGALLFTLGIGCGSSVDGSQVSSDSLAVTGSTAAGEQLALPDAEGAGAKDKPGRVQKDELAELTALLGLTDEQVAQIQPILDDTRTALEDVRAQVRTGSLSETDARSQVKALHEAQKAKILALLTAEQQAKFAAMRGHHHEPFDLTRLTAALGLSADQASQIGALQSAAQTRITDIHTQVEAGSLSKDDAKAQIDQILKDTRASIESVLTDEQRAQLAEILSARPKDCGTGGHGPGGPGGPGGPKGPGGPGAPTSPGSPTKPA